MHTECGAETERLVCGLDTTELTDVHNNIISSTGDELRILLPWNEPDTALQAGRSNQAA